MSNVDDKDLLAQELRQRAGEMSGHPVSFDAVRTRARRLQRRRQAVTGAVAAAVATVALPTGIAVNNALNEPGSPDTEPQWAATPAEPAPSSAGTAEPAPTPDADGTFSFEVAGLPRGARATVPYVVGDEQTLVTPDGEVDLGRSYSQLTPYRDGWMGLVGTEDGFENVVLADDLSVERTTPGGEGLVRDTEGTRVLYVQRDFNVPGRTVLVDEPSETRYDREQMTWDVPDEASTVLPVGYLGEDTVAFQVTAEDGRTQGYLASAGERRLRPLEGFLRLTAASEATGLVAGQVTYDPMDGSCWGVMDPARSTTDLVWQTCDYSLWQFSPDGRHVIASAPDFDGYGPAGLVVLDTATWEPVVEFTPPRRTPVALSQATWEDADTVVAVAAEGDDFTMVRAELDGTLERASETYPARDMSLPLWLAEQPRG